MPQQEISPYFFYNEGISPSELRLGSLLFDYANPRTTRRSHRHGEIPELLQDPPMATLDHREFCAVYSSQSTNAVYDFEFRKLLELGHSTAKSNSRLVVGRNGSKLELRDVDKFFEEYLLKQPEVRLWFETRLSAAKHMSGLGAAVKNFVSTPKIWLLTGVYTMEDGQVFTIRSETHSNQAASKVPIPEPTGLADLVNVKAGASVTLKSGLEAYAGTVIEGQKVWAARWIRVKARYVSSQDLEVRKDAVVNRLSLMDEWSVGTERGSEAEEGSVELVLDVGEKGSDDEGEVIWDDEQWKEFEDKVDELVEDLEYS